MVPWECFWSVCVELPVNLELAAPRTLELEPDSLEDDRRGRGPSAEGGGAGGMGAAEVMDGMPPRPTPP